MTLLDLTEQRFLHEVLALGKGGLRADVPHGTNQADLVGDGALVPPRQPLRLVPQVGERHPHLGGVEVRARGAFETQFDFAIAHAELGGEVVDDVLAVDDDFHIIGCCGFAKR